MRSMNPLFRAFVVIAFAASALPAQGELDGLITRAMSSHPDVLLAEAKLKQAEAEVLQARLKATREVVALYSEGQKKVARSEAARLNVDSVRTRLKAANDAVESGAGSKSGRDALSTELQLAMSAANEAESEVHDHAAAARYLFPAPPRTVMPNAPAGRAAQARPALSAALKAALDAVADFSVKDEGLIECAKRMLAGRGINLVVDEELSAFVTDHMNGRMIGLELRDVTLVSALTALVEQNGEFRAAFVGRDYGLFLTTRNRAEQIDAATIPSDVPLRP